MVITTKVAGEETKGMTTTATTTKVTEAIPGTTTAAMASTTTTTTTTRPVVVAGEDTTRAMAITARAADTAAREKVSGVSLSGDGGPLVVDLPGLLGAEHCSMNVFHVSISIQSSSGRCGKSHIFHHPRQHH